MYETLQIYTFVNTAKYMYMKTGIELFTCTCTQITYNCFP